MDATYDLATALFFTGCRFHEWAHRSAEQADGVMSAGMLRLTTQEKAEIEAPSEAAA